MLTAYFSPPRFIQLSVLAVVCGTPRLDAAPKDLNTPREFPPIASAREWKERAAELRQQVLVSCGLWPMPERTPLRAHIFGRVERDGYSVEKVYFQSFPGFYMGGNLYRPLGHGKGPFPGILNPHGHWKEGRMADTKDGSIAARCISFARQGMIAFSYDMLGYNDTFFPDHGDVPTDKLYLRHRRFATNETCQLWNISQMGLQTWNSIRALDFLESLPDVNRKRLACTGESGGGTQTFMLGAVDDRLAVQAPIVMVSHTMQGGCSCENAPGLRVQFSNMEIAAAAAPRPQFLVAATGDWTRATLTVEGPAIAHIYSLLKAPEKLQYVRFDFNHNYNQTSREAVYAAFRKWLLRMKPESVNFHEPPYQKEPDEILRVWPDAKLPSDALTEKQFTDWLIQGYQAQIDGLMPRSKSSLSRYKKLMLPAWRRTFQLSSKDSTNQITFHPGRSFDQFHSFTLELPHAETVSPSTAVCFGPSPGNSHTLPYKIVILVDPVAEPCDTDGNPKGLTKKLLANGYGVAVLKTSSVGENINPFANFYTTYNRTDCQLHVNDIVNLCSHLRVMCESMHARPRLILCGKGRAGLWSLLAAPAVDAVVADCDKFDHASDSALLARDLFCPGIRRLADFEGCALLGAPHPLLLHNLETGFPVKHIQTAYQSVAQRNFRMESTALSEESLMGWIDSL